MLILVTRPEPQASQWAQALQNEGLQAAALPLMDMGPPRNTAPVQQLWLKLVQHRCLMFVSPNAVQWFARQRPPQATWPSATLLAAPGPGTAKAAQEALADAGLMPALLISPPESSEQFDSEHLWPQLAPMLWADQSVVIVGGSEDGQPKGRQWLSDRWREAGATVQTIVAYERHAPIWSAKQTALAQMAYADAGQHAWLMSSSQAIEHLLALMGRPPAQATAICTHPRVAETARQAGFDQVVDSRPQLADVAQACRQLVPC